MKDRAVNNLTNNQINGLSLNNMTLSLTLAEAQQEIASKYNLAPQQVVIDAPLPVGNCTYRQNLTDADWALLIGVDRSHFIATIKAYRTLTGKGLAESKEYIEKCWNDYNLGRV